MKPYGEKFDANFMKKEFWLGVPGTKKDKSNKKAARRNSKKIVVEETRKLGRVD